MFNIMYVLHKCNENVAFGTATMVWNYAIYACKDVIPETESLDKIYIAKNMYVGT